jgi:N-acetylgalactosamine kinase
MSVKPQQLLKILRDSKHEPNGDSPIGPYFQDGYDFPADRDRVRSRYRGMVETHLERFRSPEIALARAPGRVNLIGEHTDYNGLPVFPMAVNRDMAAVFTPRSDRKVVIVNTAPDFCERSFDIGQSIPPYPTGDWGNYCKAAVQGLLDYYRENHRSTERFCGFEATIDGDIPIAAGMSSSSALVVLSALIFLAANRRDLHKSAEGRLELADLLAGAERYVGTQGGGMDQAISLMGKPGHAAKIDFFPLRIQTVPLPQNYSVVVANSTIRAAKTAEALDKYNRRPIECRLAAAILKKVFSEHCGREVPISLLGDLKQDKLAVAEAEIWAIADGALHPQPYTLQEIAGVLEQSTEKTAALYCKRRDGSIFPEPADGFKLHSRYRHVVEEGRRVEQSVRALDAGDIPEFAELMNRSHQSCRDLYEISCPELDRLVEIARESGATGSRLTGAGFGGCTVNLVENGKVEAFVQRVIHRYYRETLGRSERDFDGLIFPCRAAGGASVFGAP